MGLLRKLRTRSVEALKIAGVWGFGLLLACLSRPCPLSFAWGVPLILVGLVIRSWAAGHLRRNEQLATSGPYAYLRDPLYLGRLFLLCGVAVAANNTVTYALFAAGLIVFFLNYMPRKLKKETARLEKCFGEEYTEYHRHVRSLIPRLRPYPKRSTQRWSFGIFRTENREQWFILGAITLIGLMALKWWGVQEGWF